VRTWNGDAGAAGQWQVTVVQNKSEGVDVITLQPRAWPDWYLYVARDAWGTLLLWQGSPAEDPQGRFIRRLIDDRVIPKMVVGSTVEVAWE